MLKNEELPQWLSSLLYEKFFDICTIHQESRKNEKNIFCLDCCKSFCPHCSISHQSHRLLQVRRYIYQDVIRLSDAEKLMDCAFVQANISNKAKVVFLNERPQSTKTCRGSNNCTTCERDLKEPYLFCSLSCKLQHILKTENGLSNYLYNCEHLLLPEPGLDDDQTAPDSAGSVKTESRSTGTGGAAASIGGRALFCTATTEIVRKKRSSLLGFRSPCGPVSSPATEMTAAMLNRRKGGRPQRAPLY